MKTPMNVCYWRQFSFAGALVVAWVLDFALAPFARGQLAPHFDPLVFGTNQPSLFLSGPPDSNYVVETSFDLILGLSALGRRNQRSLGFYSACLDCA